ncbi:MAG TPA: DUF167 domain-containing protein [Stellaceae bacterium]|nr:DUF167 domain-containing protein [Stellaceae bacterium]
MAEPPLPACCSRLAGGIRLSVRLQPKASAERVVGLVAEADGTQALKIAVTAPPADGKANAALLRLLARLFRLPPRDLEVVLGAADRRKVVAIAGAPAKLAPIVAEGLRKWSKPAS